MNLAMIDTLREQFQCKVGYSAHQVGIGATVWSVVRGAEMIEQHLTLDSAGWGSDQLASIEALQFARLVSHVRSFERALGDGEKRVWDSELPARTKLRGTDE